MRTTNQSGIAMITTLLVLMLMSALLVGFTTVVMSDQRYRFIDRDRNQAFYAASAGIEKLTADLGNLFLRTSRRPPRRSRLDRCRQPADHFGDHLCRRAGAPAAAGEPADPVSLL